MPRKHKRKDYTIGKEAAFFAGDAGMLAGRQECIGCAFAGYGYICTTSDGKCLKSPPPEPVAQRRDSRDGNNR